MPIAVLLFTVVEILVKLFAIITLPIVSKNLSVEDFGLARLFLDVSTLYVTISSLGMIPACLNASGRGNIKAIYAKSIVVAYQAFLVILIPFSFYLGYLGYSALAVIGILLFAKISLYVGYARSYLILNGHKKIYALYMLFQVVILFGLMFGLDYLELLSLTSYIFASAASAIPVFWFVSFGLMNASKYKLDDEFKRFSKRSFVSSLFQFMSTSGDKLLLVKFFEPTLFGIYGVLALLASVLRVAVNSLVFAMQPYYYLDKSLVLLRKYIFWIQFSIPVGLFMFNYLGIIGLNFLLAESYDGVLMYIPAYSAGVLLEVWANLISQSLIKNGESTKILLSDVLMFVGKIVSILVFYLNQEFVVFLVGYYLSGLSRLVMIRSFVNTDTVFSFPFGLFILIQVSIFYLGFVYEYL